MSDERLKKFNELYKETNNYLKAMLEDIEDDIDEVLIKSGDACNHFRFAKPNEIIFDTYHKLSQEEIKQIEQATGLTADYYIVGRSAYNCITDKLFECSEIEYHFFFEMNLEDDDYDCDCNCGCY